MIPTCFVPLQDGAFAPVCGHCLYSFICNSFIALGGDGYDTTPLVNDALYATSSGIVDADCLAEYLKSQNGRHGINQSTVELERGPAHGHGHSNSSVMSPAGPGRIQCVAIGPSNLSAQCSSLDLFPDSIVDENECVRRWTYAGCSVGEFGSRNVCEPCSPGGFSLGESEHCSVCSPGTYQVPTITLLSKFETKLRLYKT